MGRGCLAGPVYAGAVVLDPDRTILGLDDSKRLSAQVREGLAPRIASAALGVAIGAATPAEIDSLGIARATELAMRRAVEGLRRSGVDPDLLLIDAVALPGAEAEQRRFVGGDGRIAAIAAASIVAKVARDRQMERLHLLYPHYGFDQHKGYGTPAHLAALRRYGPSALHRLTFDGVLAAPVAHAGARSGRAA